MLEPRHLNNAPIVEAVIDLVVTPPPDFKIERLRELKEKMTDYPAIREINQNTFEIIPNKPLAVPPTPKKCGYVFTSNDGRYIAQVRADEFIFSRLKPYSSWEDFSTEARKIWGYYSAIVNPSSVKRVVLRYINQLKLPLPVNFATYFSVPPRVPEGLPDVTSGFFSQIVAEDIQNKVSTMVVQLSQPLTDPAFMTAILDIASFRQGDLDVDAGKIWGILEVLRHAKNRAFFGSITEQTLELFK